MEAPVPDQAAGTPLSVEQFLKHLADSGLMTAEDIQACVAQIAAGSRADARQLAQELVRREKLTRYQALMLLQGKPKGLVLGNYIILDKLGQGGMGMVLKARHRRMDRVVALKVLSPAVVKTPTVLQRFQREIKAAAKLSHPNIVAAYDADEAKGVHFLVMEYVAGRDLSAVVKERGPLPVELAVQCVLQAAQGLRHAHEAGIVHRDIKPANLLLATSRDRQGGEGGPLPDGHGSYGIVKILDMGLARIEGPANQPGTAADDLTQSGSILGTCDYMAPEQALNTKRADARADIYSLGCTLYYLLTGKAMYGGETLMEKMMAHQEQRIPPLANAPRKLQAVFARMVAKKPEDRPPGMAAVIAELETSLPRPGTPAALAAWMQGSSAAAPPAGTDEATQGYAEVGSHQPEALARPRRKPSLTLRVSVGALALLLLSAVGFYLWPKSDPGKTAATNPTRERGPGTAAQSTEPEKLFTNSLGMKMVLIPKGKFLMGGGGGNPGTKEVEIKHRFYLGQYEVTQWEWMQVMANNPSTFKNPPAAKPLTKEERAKLTLDELQKLKEKEERDNKENYWKSHPVENVSWEDCQEYVKRLNQKEKTPGWEYRLPTEAEWEYACRGGGGRPVQEYGFDYYFEQPTNNLLPEMANFKDSGKNRACKVGSYQPNRLGLYDMHGNVLEWCQDEIPGDPKDPKAASQRMLRGGGRGNDSKACRAANRLTSTPSSRYHDPGLRLARVSVGSGDN